MNPLEVASAHKASRERLTSRATARALRLWRSMQLGDLDASWDRIAPLLLDLATAAQLQAAKESTSYVNRVADYYGGADAAVLVPEAFTGVALDGREIVPAAYSAVTATKTLIGRGVAQEQAFLTGASYLATVFGAAIQDMGRMADLSLGSARGYPRFVRVVSPTACSRCAILAGKSSGAVAFLRHPRCRCSVWLMPNATATTPAGMFDNPDEFFDSLSPAQQDRTFTKAGAFAIRNGADPLKVVNARRGAYKVGSGTSVNLNRLMPLDIGVKADGSRLRVFATVEGTTARGAFGRRELELTGQATRAGRYRRTTTVRLMPEQILKMARNNPARARELLIKYGYIV